MGCFAISSNYVGIGLRLGSGDLELVNGYCVASRLLTGEEA